MPLNEKKKSGLLRMKKKKSGLLHQMANYKQQGKNVYL